VAEKYYTVSSSVGSPGSIICQGHLTFCIRCVLKLSQEVGLVSQKIRVVGICCIRLIRGVCNINCVCVTGAEQNLYKIADLPQKMPSNVFVVYECQDAMVYSQYVSLSFKGQVVLSCVQKNSGSQRGRSFTQCI
jgi:hypothetical protein